MLLALVLASCPSGYASGPHGCVFVPAPVGDQTCGMDGHRHSMDLDDKGQYVVNKEAGEPDIVFDGLCHDEHERVLNDSRKVLPVPKA